MKKTDADCQITVQFWCRGVDDDALLELDQVGILLMFYDLKFVPLAQKRVGVCLCGYVCACSHVCIFSVCVLYDIDLGGLALSLRFWPRIKQLVSNCPASDWTFSSKTVFLLNRVKIN